MTVVQDAAPSLVLPGALTVEGNRTAGATVTYAVGANDPEDAAPPTPACAPASGSFFPLGATDVRCSAEDSAGHRVTGTFVVSVVDTTPPVLVGVPGQVDLTTSDPSGAPATYTPPTATDVVDPTPHVSCSTAPGTWIPTGITVVECVARDARNNASRASFPVTVTYVPVATEPPVATFDVVFGPPIGRDNLVRALAGSVIPVRARILRDGIAVHREPWTSPWPAATAARSFAPHSRWSSRAAAGLNLRTRGLEGCVRATLRVDGVAAGTFDLRLWSPPWVRFVR